MACYSCAPGTTAIVNETGGSGNISVVARSNGNYSLDIDLDQLDHTTNPTAYMDNDTVSVRGGNVSSPAQIGNPGEVFIWGHSDGTPQWALNDTISFDTTDIEYRIAIPIDQIPGDYTGTLHYHLVTEE